MQLIQLPEVILQHIANFLKCPFKFRDWVYSGKILHHQLYFNKNAGYYLEQLGYDLLNKFPHGPVYKNLNYYSVKIIENRMSLMENNYCYKFPEIIHLIERILPCDVSYLIMNPAATRLFGMYRNCLNYISLYANPGAIKIIEKNPEKINWNTLSENPAAIHLLEANPDKIYWPYLSANPAAVHLLEANPDKIDWDWISMNPAAAHIIEKNLDKINWKHLSSNPGAIHILEKHPEKINWHYLSVNPEIFIYDAAKSQQLARELFKTFKN